MTHTEESLMALADAAMWQASLQSGNDKDIALRRAIREVLAERDELRKLQEHCLLGMKYCPQRSRAEKAAAGANLSEQERVVWVNSWYDPGKEPDAAMKGQP